MLTFLFWRRPKQRVDRDEPLPFHGKLIVFAYVLGWGALAIALYVYWREWSAPVKYSLALAEALLAPDFAGIRSLFSRSAGESWGLKLLFVTVFVSVAAVVFLVSEPLADWLKSEPGLASTFAVQAVLAMPFALVIFALEAKVIWRLMRQDVFSSIHPVSLGAYVGYVVHFALG